MLLKKAIEENSISVYVDYYVRKQCLWRSWFFSHPESTYSSFSPFGDQAKKIPTPKPIFSVCGY
jgi:hypothetical protein